MFFNLIQQSALVFFILGISSSSFSQNLVLNPSFENHLNCPKILGNLEQDVAHWSSPTLGSTDYFNGCSDAMGTPKNFNGEQSANFGIGYVGLYFYAPEDYREYLQATLSRKLKKDEVYKISFYVSLAERSDFAIQEFGVQFSEVQIKVETRKTLSKMHFSRVNGDVSNYIEISYDEFYSDKKDWVLVEKEFKAKGTENYLIIGNFKDNKSTRKFKTKRKATQGSYYYLDMVSLVPKSNRKTNAEVLEPVLSNEKYEIDKTNTFKNVLFGFDTYNLKPEAKKELNQIVAFLQKNETLVITLKGHTDAIGNEQYNQSLSKKRAEAVANFLIKKGLEKERITHAGYGSSKPITTNTTINGRYKNRRVEFVITNKI
ncbi:OmpA family protein [Maribacter sp. CXY002]|uniref:OmpA family protein n=1 Tax=Maribacter luteocoastalis TaxID=3407671 RepID=UPI003B66BD34